MAEYKIQRSSDKKEWQDLDSPPAYSWSNWTNRLPLYEANRILRALRRYNYAGQHYRMIEIVDSQ